MKAKGILISSAFPLLHRIRDTILNATEEAPSSFHLCNIERTLERAVNGLSDLVHSYPTHHRVLGRPRKTKL